jgi:hypothetical protein
MKTTVSNTHIICNDWIRELQFYQSEMPFFRKRLAEVSSDYSSDEVKLQVDHFENKFTIMEEHFDELLHDVKIKEQAIINYATEKPNYINAKMIEMDDKIDDLMDFTANDFKETKKEFYRFLSKYM